MVTTLRFFFPQLGLAAVPVNDPPVVYLRDLRFVMADVQDLAFSSATVEDLEFIPE